MNCFVNCVLYVCWCVKSLGKLLEVLKNCHSDRKKTVNQQQQIDLCFTGVYEVKCFIVPPHPYTVIHASINTPVVLYTQQHNFLLLQALKEYL